MNARQLRNWRKKRKLSQKDAAALIGCSRRAYQNYEHGQTIPRSIALAVAAVEGKKKPYGC